MKSGTGVTKIFKRMMKISIAEAIKEVRIVLDDIAKEADEDFAADEDMEIEAALKRAARDIIDEAPAEYLIPVFIGGSNPDPTPSQVKNADGTGYVVLPADFHRLLNFKLYSWQQAVWDVLNPASDEAKMQASRWTRGTPNKPKAMLDHDNAGALILRYWTAGEYTSPTASAAAGGKNHDIEYLNYIPGVQIAEDGETEAANWVLTIPLRDDVGLQDKIIYRAAGLFLVGKKETEYANTFFKLSTLTNISE